MKRLASLLIAPALLLAGCANLDRGAYNAENTLADGIGGARHTFNTWYSAELAQNPATNTVRLAQLNAARDYVHEQVYHAAVVLNTVDQLRLEYKQVSSDTNATALQMVIKAAPEVLSNLEVTVTYFMKGGLVPAFNPPQPPGSNSP